MIETHDHFRSVWRNVSHCHRQHSSGGFVVSFAAVVWSALRDETEQRLRRRLAVLWALDENEGGGARGGETPPHSSRGFAAHFLKTPTKPPATQGILFRTKLTRTITLHDRNHYTVLGTSRKRPPPQVIATTFSVVG